MDSSDERPIEDAPRRRDLAVAAHALDDLAGNGGGRGVVIRARDD
jgi:hypothetical protein